MEAGKHRNIQRDRNRTEVGPAAHKLGVAAPGLYQQVAGVSEAGYAGGQVQSC